MTGAAAVATIAVAVAVAAVDEVEDRTSVSMRARRLDDSKASAGATLLRAGDRARPDLLPNGFALLPMLLLLLLVALAPLPLLDGWLSSCRSRFNAAALLGVMDMRETAAEAAAAAGRCGVRGSCLPPPKEGCRKKEKK